MICIVGERGSQMIPISKGVCWRQLLLALLLSLPYCVWRNVEPAVPGLFGFFPAAFVLLFALVFNDTLVSFRRTHTAAIRVVAVVAAVSLASVEFYGLFLAPEFVEDETQRVPYLVSSFIEFASCFVFVASLLLLDDEKEPGDPGVLRISLLLGFSIAILFWVGASLFDLTDRIECAVYFLVALPVAWLAIRVLENFAGELTSFHIVAGHEVAYVAIVLSRGEELSFGFYSGVKLVVPLAIVVAMVALACLVVPRRSHPAEGSQRQSSTESDGWTLEGDGIDELSNREQQVLAHLVAGEKNAAIAQNMGISPSSVSTFKGRAFAKLGIQDYQQLMERVREGRLVIQSDRRSEEAKPDRHLDGCLPMYGANIGIVVFVVIARLSKWIDSYLFYLQAPVFMVSPYVVWLLAIFLLVAGVWLDPEAGKADCEQLHDSGLEAVAASSLCVALCTFGAVGVSFFDIPWVVTLAVVAFCLFSIGGTCTSSRPIEARAKMHSGAMRCLWVLYAGWRLVVLQLVKSRYLLGCIFLLLPLLGPDPFKWLVFDVSLGISGFASIALLYKGRVASQHTDDAASSLNDARIAKLSSDGIFGLKAQVAIDIADGLGDKEISERRNTTVSTVKTYRRRLCKQLGVHGAEGIRSYFDQLTK